MKPFSPRKICFLLLFIFFTGTSFAQNFGTEFLKHTNLTVNCPFSLTTGDIFYYSKANLGVELRLGTELFSLPINNKPVTFGLCTTYNYNNYLFIREELSQFYSNCILEGIWFTIPLPNNFFIQTDLDIGLAITKAKALSIEGKPLENFYNSLIAGTSIVVTRKLFEAGPCQIAGDAGLELRGYFEEDSWFQSFGILAGIMVKAR